MGTHSKNATVNTLKKLNITVQAGLPITRNWTTTQKKRRIYHRIKEFFGVILLIFREESESE